MSTVIKSGEAGPVLRRLSTVDLADHLSEAHAVISQARDDAARIVSEARYAARTLLKESREEGFKLGYRRGYEEGTTSGQTKAHADSMELFTRQHSQVVDTLQNAVSELDDMKASVKIQAEKDVLDFAVSVASKLTFAIGSHHAESALGNLRRALELVASRTDLTIRVHPADLSSIETFADSAIQTINASPSVCIVPDESLAPGGCRILAGQTEIDSSLETQVEEMVALLAAGVQDDA